MALPKVQLTPTPAKRAEPEYRAFTLKRDGPNFRIVTLLVQGDRVLALDESDSDARLAQVGRIERELLGMP
jgi:hypothetical protein